MKNTFFVFILIFFSSIVFGQAPDKINYQGVLRDANGNVVANKSISGSIVISGGSNYTFSIPNGSSTNSYGLFNFKICPINGVDWYSSSVTITSTIAYMMLIVNYKPLLIHLVLINWSVYPMHYTLMKYKIILYLEV